LVTRFRSNAASGILTDFRSVEILINNAGVMAVPLARDSRGYEAHLSINHLGPFQLTLELLPTLARATRARVVNLSSGAHRRSAFDFDDPNFLAQPYDKWIAYARSKTAGVLSAVALATRVEDTAIRVYAVHPRRIETNLQRWISLDELQRLGFRNAAGEIPSEQRKLYKSVEQGAATTVWCATDPALDHVSGVYCEDCHIAPRVPSDRASPDGVLPWAVNEIAAERLWQMSEEMLGLANNHPS